MGCLIKFFIMVDAKRSCRPWHRPGASDLRGKEARGYAGKDHKGGESGGNSALTLPRIREFLSAPFHGKCNWRRAEHAEVIAIVRVFPDVFSGEDQISPDRLLNSSMKFVPSQDLAELNSRRNSPKAGSRRDWRIRCWKAPDFH